MNGLDNRRIAGRSDSVVLSYRFDILSDNRDVGLDVDSECLRLSHELSRDDLQRLSSSDERRFNQAPTSTSRRDLQRSSTSDKRMCYQVGENNSYQSSDTVTYFPECGSASSAVDKTFQRIHFMV